MDVMTICVVGFRSVQICQPGKRIRLKSSPVKYADIDIKHSHHGSETRQASLPEPISQDHNRDQSIGLQQRQTYKIKL